MGYFEAGKVSSPALRMGTGSAALDRALGGGVPSGELVQVFGPAASGKTQLLLSICLRHAGSRTLYADTQGKFRPERLEEMRTRSGIGGADILDRMDVLSSDEPARVHRRIGEACLSGDYGLICVDDLSEAFLRRGYENASVSMLSLTARTLSVWSLVRGTHAVVTERVRYDPSSKSEKPVGSEFTSPYIGTSVRLQRMKSSFHATVDGASARFGVTAAGVTDV
ncbi:MAG: hypothetical protein JRN29_00605 [Nitrososphaerota archaeon]|nr:hypothetical protein [Nitrososphaerota archaeon]